MLIWGQGLLNVTYTLFREGVVTLKDAVTTNPAPPPPPPPPPPPRLPPPAPHVMRKGDCPRMWWLTAGQGAGFGADVRAFVLRLRDWATAPFAPFSLNWRIKTRKTRGCTDWKSQNPSESGNFNHFYC